MNDEFERIWKKTVLIC